MYTVLCTQALKKSACLLNKAKDTRGTGMKINDLGKPKFLENKTETDRSDADRNSKVTFSGRRQNKT